jgi:hypothetical protein
VVGPDLFLLLQGRLFDDGTTSVGIGGGKNVSLILCGESHNDAIDVTRQSPPGKFDAKEGWIQVFDSSQSDGSDISTALPRALVVPSSRKDSTGQQQQQQQPQQQQQQQQPQRRRSQLPSIENLALRYLHPVNGKKNKSVTLARAKELASAFVEKFEIEEDMFGRNLLLLWVANNSGYSDRIEKGEAFLVEIELEVQIEDAQNNLGGGGGGSGGNNGGGDDDDTDSDYEEEVYDDWVFFTNDFSIYDHPLQEQNRCDLPYAISQWMDDVMMVVHDDQSTACTLDNAIDDISEEFTDEGKGKRKTVVDTTACSNGDELVPSRHERMLHARLGRYVLFEYGDLDTVAHDMSKRRLGYTDAELTTSEYDDVIESRKRTLGEKHNVWTFDHWFDYVKAGTETTGGVARMNGDRSKPNGNAAACRNDDPAVHLVLEASIPPSEVELHRPRLKDENTGDVIADAESFRLHLAAESVRCLSEDSESSWEEEYDPSNDGIGSYADFMYRRMMKATTKTDTKLETKETTSIQEEKKMEDGGDDHGDESVASTVADDVSDRQENQNHSGNSWLHCIDMRDLGSEEACHAESVKEQWYELLSQEEREVLSGEKEVARDACPVNREGDTMRFLPANKMNPELTELEHLKAKNTLLLGHDDEPESRCQVGEDMLEFTFPSFEAFFGINTDILYYSPNVKVAHSPFLVDCVESLDNWKDFFTALFFGGTIPEALKLLNLEGENSRNSFHVRSPILQRWDAESETYVFEKRNDDEYYTTCPFFPFAFHLVAKGSSPPRTWSSQLFADLHDFDDCQIEHSHHSHPNILRGVYLAEGQTDHLRPRPNSRRSVALAIKTWILDAIHREMEDPKGADDKECGGEWFTSYLRAVHREIYDDIDASDAAVLLQKNQMKSLSRGRLKKHNLGKIKIPSAKHAFEEVLARFRKRDSLPPWENVVTPRVEVLAKILIDIWMCNLLDFSLLLKIANICANESKENVVVVCYVGAAHAKAASDFFCETLGFKRTALVGKFNWEEDELQTLDLPPKLWKLSELYR